MQAVETELGFELTSETFILYQGHDPVHDNGAGEELVACKSPEGCHSIPARTKYLSHWLGYLCETLKSNRKTLASPLIGSLALDAITSPLNASVPHPVSWE